MTDQDIMNFCKDHDVKLNFEYDIGCGFRIKMQRKGFYNCHLIREIDIVQNGFGTLRDFFGINKEISYNLEEILLYMLHDLEETISNYNNPQK